MTQMRDICKGRAAYSKFFQKLHETKQAKCDVVYAGDNEKNTQDSSKRVEHYNCISQLNSLFMLLNALTDMKWFGLNLYPQTHF